MPHLDWKESDVKIQQEAERVIARVGDWEVSVWRDLGDGEPRVRDTDAAARLGFKRARDIKELIKRIWPENQGPYVRRTVRRTSMPHGGTRENPVDEYWLTEAQLLRLCAKSETKIADAILDDMIRVYMAVRRGLLPKPPPADDLYLSRRAAFNAEADQTADALMAMFPTADRQRARATIVQYALGQADTGGAGRELGYWDETTFLDLRAKLTGMCSLLRALVALGVKPKLPRPRKKGSLDERIGQLVLDLGCHRITVTVEGGANDAPAKKTA